MRRHRGLQRFTQCGDECIHGEVLAGRTGANAQLLDSVRPVILIVQVRDNYLNSAGPCSGCRGTCATVMHDNCNSCEQLFVRNLTN